MLGWVLWIVELWVSRSIVLAIKFRDLLVIEEDQKGIVGNFGQVLGDITSSNQIMRVTTGESMEQDVVKDKEASKKRKLTQDLNADKK